MQLPQVINSKELHPKVPVVKGYPSYTDLNPIYQSVSEFMKADDLDTALYILDHLPSYYRDNPPIEALALKKKIFENLMTVQDYIYSAEDVCIKTSKEDLLQYYKHPSQYRFHVISSKVRELNNKGICPHITELGPGEYWLAYGLNSEGLNFTYYPITLSRAAYARAIELLGEKVKIAEKSQPELFVCLETIEHMWSPIEIFHYYCRYQCDAQYLFFSTPKYTCFGGLPDWDTRTIAHLKTYTPKELYTFINAHWINYEWKHHDTDLIIFEGEKNK